MSYLINLDKQDLKWLQKALDKKDFREFCNQIVVKQGYAYATNGHVIHKIKCSWDEQEGTYSREGIKIDADREHPLSKRDLFDTPFNLECELSIIPNRLNVLSMGEMGLSKQYFDNAVDKSNEISIKLHENKDRVYIQYDNREVIIMGMKL